MAFTEQEKQQAREALQKIRTQPQQVQTSSSWDDFNRAVTENLAQKRLTEQAKQQVEQKKGGIGGFLKGVGNFGLGVVKSLGETALRTIPQTNPVIKTLTPLIPEKVDLPVVGETSLRYSDNFLESVKQMGEDVLNIIPGGASKKGVEQLAKEGAEGVAGRLVKSAFKVTINDIKKSPTLIKDLLMTGLTGLRKKTIANKADDVVNLLEGQLDDAIKGAKGKTISPEVVKNSTNDLIAFYENSAFPEYAQLVKSQVDDFMKRGDLPIEVAQEFKKNTYRILRQNYGKLAGPNIEAAKQINRGIKEGIEQALPDVAVADINKKLAIFGKARDLIENQINKAGKNELISLKDMVIGGAGATGPGLVTPETISALLIRRIVESVPFKTYVAKVLVSPKTNTFENLLKISVPGLKELLTPEKIEQETPQE